MDNTLFDATSLSDDRSVRHAACYEGAREILSLPEFKNFLVTRGDIHAQTIKLGVLGIGALFDGIYVCPTAADKPFLIEEILATHGEGTSRGDVYVLCGPDGTDVRVGNMLGLRTVLVLNGRPYEPKDVRGMPELTVGTLSEAAALLSDVSSRGIH